MNTPQYMTRNRKRVDEALEMLLLGDSHATEDVPPRLLQALRYSVLDGGKRLRPILVLASAEAVGGDSQVAMPAACAIELIHTFSLIHDDLPCMDDDDLRRGKPTSHKVFGEAIALLAGDALFALAFEMLMTLRTDHARVRACTLEIAQASGLHGMVGGQVADMELSRKQATLDDVRAVHRRKTGALIQASTTVGGMIGGGSDQQIEALQQYGGAIGMAFQIQDDILDVIGDTHKTGKSGGSDERNEKATYPRLVGPERAKEMATEAVERGIAALASFDSSADHLRRIAKFIIEREG